MLLNGVEKAEAIQKLLIAEKEWQEVNEIQRFDTIVLGLEKQFEDLSSQIMKVYNHIYGASVTEEEVQNWSVYRFYTVKNQLVAEKKSNR